MRNLLEEPRDVTIGGRTETFRNYAHLAERGEILLEMVQEAEARIGDDSSGSEREWKLLVERADLLAEILAAQDQWLADHDAALAVEVADLRREIRNLNLSSSIGKAEGE